MKLYEKIDIIKSKDEFIDFIRELNKETIIQKNG